MKTFVLRCLFTSLVLTLNFCWADVDVDEEKSSARYKIEGKVFPHKSPLVESNWQTNTKLHVNGGQHLGFSKNDGSFIIHNIPAGSHILEVINSESTYEPVRIEINAKGKLRARKVSHVQTSQITPVPYPLKLKPLRKTKYFEEKETWGAGEFLFNPMVLAMVLPLLIVMVLPKMLNDMENKKELAKIGGLSKFKIPEVSDRVTNFLSRAPEQNQQQANKKVLRMKKKM